MTVRPLSRPPLCVAFLAGAALSAISVSNAMGQTPVSGSITSDTHWTISGSPYVLSGLVVVNSNATLRIDGGVVVLANASATLAIGGGSNPNGALLASGDPDHRITFTSLTSGSASWGGIQFLSASNAMVSELDYCDILDGGTSNTPNLILFSTSQPTLRYCTIGGSHASGVPAVVMESSAPAWTGVTFTGNTNVSADLYLSGGSSPTLDGCHFETGSHLGIQLSEYNSVPAISNCSFAGTAPYALNVDPMSWLLGNTLSGYSQGVLFGPPASTAALRGHITADRRWYVSGPGQAYVIAEVATVENGAILTIDSGVVVKAAGGTLAIGTGASQGALHAVGSANQRITFTSLTPGSDTWGGIQFLHGSNAMSSELDYCEILEGGGSNTPSLYLGGTTQPTLQHCTLGNNRASGAPAVVMESSSPTWTDVTFTGNTNASADLYLTAGSSPTLNGCTFQTGNHLGIQLSEYNSVPAISNCSFTGTGQYAVNVDPMSWLSGNTLSGYSTGVLFYPPASTAALRGHITADRTWYALNENDPTQVYVVPGAITVRNGATLSVDPGVTVKTSGSFQFGSGATESGSLMAVGTACRPITFTSIDAGWGSMYFSNASDYNGAISQMKYCTIENGGCCGSNIMIYCQSTTVPVISNCILRNSFGWALVAEIASPVLDSCIIVGNVAGGVTSNGGAPVVATRCWWGDASGPHDASAGAPDFNPAGTGQAVSDYVSYRPWLTSVPFPASHTITATAPTGGTILPEGAVAVAWCTGQHFDISPAACYDLTDVLVDGLSQGPITGYTFPLVSTDHSISAVFTRRSYTIAASAGAGGVIGPAGDIPVLCGNSQAFTFTPAACKQVTEVRVDGSRLEPTPASYQFDDVQANHSLLVNFTTITYTVTATAGVGGSISPPGASVFDCGSSPHYVIAAGPDYAINDVIVDGTDHRGPVTSIDLGPLGANHTIDATFTALGPVAISIDDVSHPEGNSGFTPFVFTVSLSRASSQTVNVDWYTSGWLAGDLVPQLPPGLTLTFQPGDPLTRTVTVNAIGNLKLENDKTFFVVLANPVHAVIANPHGIGTGKILNDDQAPAPARLMAWWTFDDIQGPSVLDIAHLTTGRNKGALVGAATIPPAGGRVGRSLSCDGGPSGILATPSKQTLYLGPDGIAMDAWIYLNPGSSSSTPRVIASAWGRTAATLTFGVLDDRLVLDYRDGSGSMVHASPSAPMSEQAWHHVGFVVLPRTGFPLTDVYFSTDGIQSGAFTNGAKLTLFDSGNTSAFAIGYGGTSASDGFNGLIDELDVFRPSFPPAATMGRLAQISYAGSYGKRREFVRMPLTLSLDRNRVATFCATITNLTYSTQSCDWGLDSTCAASHLPFISQGSVALLPAGTSTPVSMSLNIGSPAPTCPIHLACVDVGTHVMYDTYASLAKTGTVSARGRRLCSQQPAVAWTGAGPASPSSAQTSGNVADFVLYNDGDAPASITCHLDAVDGDTGDLSDGIRLNGLPPGTPVEVPAIVGAHDSVVVSVDFALELNSPFLTDQVRLSADVDGDAVPDPIAFAMIEAVEDTVGPTAGVDPAPRATTAGISASPNPFRALTSIHFSLAEGRRVDVAVFDVVGRRVRTLRSGYMEAGEKNFVWDGRDAGGRSPGAGIYFVRIDSSGLRLGTKLILVP